MSERAPIVVSDVDDPRLDDYRALRDADHLRAERFLCEGEVVLRVLLERGSHQVRSLLLADRKLGGLAPLLVRVPSDVPVYVAPHAALERLTGFDIHRGVLASVARAALPEPRAWLAAMPARATVVALEGLTNHDNVGGVFRNAAAFGADGVLLDERSCDPLYRKAIRVSVGGALVVPFARAAAPLACLREAGFYTVALTPRREAKEIAELGALSGRVALVLGSEGPGLSTELLDGADVCARIAIAPGFDSLNVATASGIALYALARANPENSKP